MKTFIAATVALGITALASSAWAEWTITNKDESSYELIRKCGDKSEDWSIAGGVTKTLSIPAGATQCTLTMKRGGSSCTVKDGEGCVIQSTKISKK